MANQYTCDKCNCKLDDGYVKDATTEEYDGDYVSEWDLCRDCVYLVREYIFRKPDKDDRGWEKKALRKRDDKDEELARDRAYND